MAKRLKDNTIETDGEQTEMGNRPKWGTGPNGEQVQMGNRSKWGTGPNGE